VIGVADPKMAERMIRVLAANGATRALVVYGHDGLDELTTTTSSTVLELRDGEIRESVVDPTAFGLAGVERSDLVGGDAATNARLAGAVLAGDKGPHRDVVVLNAAAGLLVAGIVDQLGEGIEVAAAAIDDGKASAVVERLVAVSRREAGD
jgi:anthranilate phosphoribosyltransferase